MEQDTTLLKALLYATLKKVVVGGDREGVGEDRINGVCLWDDV